MTSARIVILALTLAATGCAAPIRSASPAPRCPAEAPLVREAPVAAQPAPAEAALEVVVLTGGYLRGHATSVLPTILRERR